MADPTPFGVRAASGTLREGEGVVLPHAWTEEGVLAGPATNGAQLLHLAVAAPAETLGLLLEVVDEVAEIPRVLRAGADVRRSGE